MKTFKRRGFLRALMAASATMFTNVMQWSVPEAIADDAAQMNRGSGNWQHEYLGDEELESLILAADGDTDVRALVGLYGAPLASSDPAVGSHVVGEGWTFDLIKRPYVRPNAPEQVVAYVAFGTMSYNSESFPMKLVAFDGGDVYISLQNGRIDQAPNDEKTEQLMQILFPRDSDLRTSTKQLGGGGPVQPIPVRPPCLPADCDLRCAVACVVGGVLLLGCIIAAVACLTGIGALLCGGPIWTLCGGAALFAGACILCYTLCFRGNRRCCAQLRAEGWDVSGVCP